MCPFPVPPFDPFPNCQNLHFKCAPCRSKWLIRRAIGNEFEPMYKAEKMLNWVAVLCFNVSTASSFYLDFLVQHILSASFLKCKYARNPESKEILDMWSSPSIIKRWRRCSRKAQSQLDPFVICCFKNYMWRKIYWSLNEFSRQN